MKLVPVTPETLPRHVAVLSEMLNENDSTESKQVEKLAKGIIAEYANQQREVGVRAVVDVLRRLWNLTNEGTSEAELLEATRDADELLTLYPEQP
jgi:hypothetical protein